MHETRSWRVHWRRITRHASVCHPRVGTTPINTYLRDIDSCTRGSYFTYIHPTAFPTPGTSAGAVRSECRLLWSKPIIQFTSTKGLPIRNSPVFRSSTYMNPFLCYAI